MSQTSSSSTQTPTIDSNDNGPGPIGIFDSGYGGLTVLIELQKKFPNQRFLYLGDNARAPYGTRSFDTIYQYTLEAVKYLFSQNCHLVILACNTASARALRTIQQIDLPNIAPHRRVLGIIRPMTEYLTDTVNNTVGILATRGTVESESYILELEKLAPKLTVIQKACPMWVPLVENREVETPATDFFIDKYLSSMEISKHSIEKLVLACTHYPVLQLKIEDWLAKQNHSEVEVLRQGKVVADKLADYLDRHPEIQSKIEQINPASLNGSSQIEFQTTETTDLFNPVASHFLGYPIKATQVKL